MTEKLNKLQLRAKVFDILKTYNSQDDFASDCHDENIKFLNNIEDKNFVAEILIKELTNAVDFEQEKIKILITEFATLEMVENTIWQVLKDTTLPDTKKETFLHLLRTLGGKIDVENLMDCMNDFDAVVDTQTQELLQVAAINPEAQIDFLDFLLSLKENEQLQLVKSLENDFPGDELANIISPCLRIRISDKIKEEVIFILGKSKSYLAIKPLKNYIQANEDALLKKLALKALNQLQASGIMIDNDELANLRENEICKSSTFYKAYLSQIDGCANQGLIFSRITKDDKIIMFSTVINAVDGIMDCFGLQDITVSEFQKVISRFKDNDLVVPISAELAKSKLLNAEKINNENGTHIPYEYLCWSIYSCDIEAISMDFSLLKNSEIKNFPKEIYEELYDSEIFDTWFFEYDDNIDVQRLIDFCIELHNLPAKEMFEQIENKLENELYKIFTLKKLDEYSLMLQNAGYVFYLNQDFSRANIAVNLAEALKNGETRFLKDILRRSLLQHLANIITQEDTKEQNRFAFQKNKQQNNIEKEEALELIHTLEEYWQRMEAYE